MEDIQPVKKLKFAKTTFSKAPPLYSQRIVIGTEELSGKNIDKLVRQKIDSFEKSPKVVRSTALIIKTSKTPSNGCLTRERTKNNSTNDLKSNGNVNYAPMDFTRGLSSSSGSLLLPRDNKDIINGARKHQVNSKLDPALGRRPNDGDVLRSSGESRSTLIIHSLIFFQIICPALSTACIPPSLPPRGLL